MAGLIFELRLLSFSKLLIFLRWTNDINMTFWYLYWFQIYKKCQGLGSPGTLRSPWPIPAQKNSSHFFFLSTSYYLLSTRTQPKGYLGHPPSEINLGLKFEEHEKTQCSSILGPFSYTVGASHFFFPGRINRFCKSHKITQLTGLCTGSLHFLYF